MVAAADLDDEDQRRQRCIGDRAEERGHADDDIGGRLLHDIGKVLLAEQAHRAAEHTADKERGTEDAARTAAGDGAAGSEDLEQGQHQKGAQPEFAAEPLLQKTETRAQYPHIDEGQ